MLKPISPLIVARAPTYREAAYTAIKEAILAGQIGPGQALIEERLAAMLDISRTPVREALAILEHEGLIAPVYRRGLYVCKLTRTEFVELFVANETVEPALARRAALRATEDELAAMDAAITRGIQCAAEMDIPGFLRSGREFHGLVGRSSGNLPLTTFIERNEERVDLYLLSYGKAVDALGMQASNREHGTIFKAIVDRDPEAAARLVVYHAQSTRERWAALFNDAGDEEGNVAVDAERYVMGD